MANIKDIKLRYNIIGRSPALDSAIATAQAVAPTDCSVLILGENGSGKDVFSRIIHDYSRRKKKTYLAINCGALPKGTIESELFGHKRGSFTGADDEHEGYFATCNGGTLFLDEIAELPMETQARLLRVLENGEYIPVGSNEAFKTNVRIVAATNVDLGQAIARGKFRQDLFFRLSVVTINVPPLRERGRDDVRMLFNYFADYFSEKYSTPEVVTLTEAALDKLATYSWPGNVRQVRNLAESLTITAPTPTITPDMLVKYLLDERMMPVKSPTDKEPDEHMGVMACLSLIRELAEDLADLRSQLGLERKGGSYSLYEFFQKNFPQQSPRTLADKRSVAYTEGAHKPYTDYADDEYTEVVKVDGADEQPDTGRGKR